MNKGFDCGRALSSLTIGEFLEMLDQHLGNTGNGNHPESGTPAPTGRLVYGLRGIQDLFHCSHKQAQYYKDHVIQEAVSQHGRKIVVDADKALELFNQRRKRHD